MRVALSSDFPVQAPPPAEAHQRRWSWGADTTPTTTSSSTTSEMSVAHTGTPRTKFLVPSIGSTIQRRWLLPVVPCSSPVTASRERTRESVRRIAERLGVSPKTVETHRERIKGKLGLSTANELVARAVRFLVESAEAPNGR